MHTCDPQSGGVLAPHPQANVAGRHMVDHQDARWRGGHIGKDTETRRGMWWTT